MSLAAESSAGAAETPGAARRSRLSPAARQQAVITAQRAIACAPPDPDTIFSVLARAAYDVLGPEAALTSQPVGDFIVCRSTAGTTATPVGDVIPIEGTLGGLAVRTREPQLCEDGRTDPRTNAAINARNGSCSSVIVPLVHQGEAIALVAALSSTPYAFDEHDLDLLAMLADVGAHRLAHALTVTSHHALESRSRAIVDAMTSGLVVQDMDGVIVFANNAALTTLRLPLDQVLGRTSLDTRWRVVREDGSPWPGPEHPSVVALSTGRPQRDEVMGVYSGTGELRWMHVNAVPMFDADDRMTGVVVSFDDITAQRQVDDELRVARRRLEAAIDLAGLATWEVDLATGKLSWSRAMFTMFGLDPAGGEPDPDTHRSLIHPDDRDALEATGKACALSRQPAQRVVRVLHSDGSVRHLWNQMDVAVDGAGRVTTLWGTTQDVTERERTARAIGASEQHFRVAFDNAPIGMSMISLAEGEAGRYLRGNAAFMRMLGYDAAELAALTMADLTHPEDVDADMERFARIVAGLDTSIAFDKRFLRKDGTTAHAWLTSSVVHGVGGEQLYLITHAVDMTDHRQQQAELQRLALTDTLTGLANRTLLTDRLDQSLARMRRTDTSCALLLLDVDRFKLVNDSLGHQAGDALLVEVAHRLREVTRADSTVARLGGDEFVVLVEALDHPDNVHAIAARLMERLRRPYHLDGDAEPIVATVSIGIAIAGEADRTAIDLYREADLALYRAKDSGRDQYALFDAALKSRVETRMQEEALLRRALAEDLVVPWFQPIVDLTTGEISAVESLARLDVPGRGIVGPVDFVDVAEETGLIVDVDSTMLQRGLEQFARWVVDPSMSLRRLSTNVSARSLETPEFVDRIRQAMATYDVPGSAIRVEITELSLLTMSPTVTQSLERIAELGIEIGLDDFGTGYSALGYLQRFQLSFLKIDRSFVSRLGTARDDAVVASVIDLAHAHDLLVVAEGVETVEQLDALRTMGCDRAQGYLLGRPLPPSELEGLVRARPRW